MPVRIIATGGHSGLGFEALNTLLASSALDSGGSLTLMVRDQHAAPVDLARQTLAQQFSASRPTSSTSSANLPPELSIQTCTMDLASLASVRNAASSIKTQIQIRTASASASASASGIDIFLLNAAVAKCSRETVRDIDRASASISYPPDHLVNEDSCVETTACVNHVAHLLFISSLIPTITQNANNGRKSRIIFTGSALHRSLKHPAVLDAFFSSLSHSSTSPWTLRETYAASKFLQMLGVRALHRRIHDALKPLSVPPRSVELVVVQPGFVPQTALCRETGVLTRFAMSYVLPWAPFTTTLQDAGTYIANACTIQLPNDSSDHADRSEHKNGFHEQQSSVPFALLEVHAKTQRFGMLDPRTANLELQEQWWPAACDNV